MSSFNEESFFLSVDLFKSRDQKISQKFNIENRNNNGYRQLEMDGSLGDTLEKKC